MKELQKEFDGRGEVKGYHFRQIETIEYAYLYEVKGQAGNTHYEVFERKENTQFNSVSYPSSKAFGNWAYTVHNLSDATERLQELNERVKSRKMVAIEHKNSMNL